jgi:hypothetical protein
MVHFCSIELTSVEEIDTRLPNPKREYYAK